MSILEIAFTVFMMATFGLLLFSVIGWLVVFLVDRQNVVRRKKFAIMCLISVGIIVLAMVVSTVITFRRNSM